MRAVPSVAQVHCPGCETMLLVLPEVLASDLDVRSDALREALNDKSGDRFTVADHEGFFDCPRCSMRGCAPELRT